MAKSKTVRELIGAGARFLGDYRVANHVKADQVEDVTLDGVRCKAPASRFFRDKAKLLTMIDGSRHGKAFNVVFFDTFMVIEMAPGTLNTSFLVLVPNFETKTGSYVLNEALSLESTSVLDTLDVIRQSRGQTALLVEVEEILAALNATAC